MNRSILFDLAEVHDSGRILPILLNPGFIIDLIFDHGWGVCQQANLNLKNKSSAQIIPVIVHDVRRVAELVLVQM